MTKRANIIVVAAALALGGAADSTAAADVPPDRCFADWSAAAPVVRAEALMPAKDVHEQARIRHIGDVVRMTLCEERGRFVYRLVVREPKGQVVTRVVDARKPF